MTHSSKRPVRDALIVGSIAAGMFALAFAAYPFYRIFCSLTGFEGVPRVRGTDAAPAPKQDVALRRAIELRFNADVDKDLPWKFAPEAVKTEAALGQEVVAYFTTENLSDETVTGLAGYNVAPYLAATYVEKIECFCFTKQTLAPGEKKRMAVTFVVDPEITNDPDLRDINAVTLSYTFHRDPSGNAK
ncbi:MAG: cytochrome c oxidase assembly protein [Rickettsiales bacterium]